MKRFGLLLCIVAVCAFPLRAQAGAKCFMDFLFSPPESTLHKEFRPYPQDPILEQNRQWDSDGWQPQTG
ncbi:MAG: hypothetical protein LRY36_02440 [Alphaproteobacteria bacterium]|nr:hypothetical protein [Alphaproteobacteria bacterium]